MSLGLTIPLLDSADFQLTQVVPDFVQTTSDILGNAMTDSDGFDDILTPVVQSIDVDISSYVNDSEQLQQADFVDGELQSQTWDPIVPAFNTVMTNTANIVDKYSRDIVAPDLATWGSSAQPASNSQSSAAVNNDASASDSAEKVPTMKDWSGHPEVLLQYLRAKYFTS